MQSHQQRKETKDLVLVISEKGNWKRSRSVMDRSYLEVFIFLNNIPDIEDITLCSNARGGGTKQKQAVRGKTCTVEKAETTYGIDIFYHTLPSVLELDTKQLGCNSPCLSLSSDEIIFINIEEFRLIDNYLLKKTQVTMKTRMCLFSVM